MPVSNPPSPVSSQASLHNQSNSPTSQGPLVGSQATPDLQSPSSRNNTQATSISQSRSSRNNTQATTNSVVPPSRNSTQASGPSVQSPSTTSPHVNGSSTQPPVSPPRGRRRSSGRPKTLFERLHSAFSPSTHDIKEHNVDPPDTTRPYDYKQQRRRLWRKSWTEWGLTFLLSGAYALTLALYQQDDHIDKKHRRIFNSLVTAIALLLGVNISNSLRSYAKMIRWRFLASDYRSLKEFDLIMGCDSTFNVISLLHHGQRFKVQIYALAWLIVQLAIVVGVGIVGLAYNLDISQTAVNTKTGDTSSINLSSISTGDYLYDLSGLQNWGIRGLALNPPADIFSLDHKYAPQGSYLRDGQGHSRRYFVDYSPDNIDLNVVSSRFIDSSVVCKQYRVTDGEYGDLGYFTYDVDGRAVNQTLYGSPGPSGLYVTANANATTGCGPRCVQVVLFQAQSYEEDIFSDIYIDHALRYDCNNTVTDVQDLYPPVDLIYSVSELISRMLAGMFAWSSNTPNGTNEYVLYQGISQIGWATTRTEGQIADYVSQWTIAGVAAMDANDGSTTGSGLARLDVPNGQQPIQAQILKVKWWAAGTILGLIPFVQFCTLILVISFANKVIIKDDTPIAVAKIYHTLLQKIGHDHGCMLRGDQLIETLEDDHNVSRVIFGTKDGPNGIKHVDIFEEGSGVSPPRNFPEADYDGAGRHTGARTWPKRTLNAHDYF